MKGLSFEELIDRYILVKPDHTYYRNATIDKFLGGFGLGYLFLREVIYILNYDIIKNIRNQ